jgi:hypothetical protein
MMDDLEKYIQKRKRQNPAFSKEFEEGMKVLRLGIYYVVYEKMRGSHKKK